MLSQVLLSTLLLCQRPDAVPALRPPQPLHEAIQAAPDTAALLTRTWVLREERREGDSELQLPLEAMVLTLRPDRTYRLVKAPKIPEGSGGEIQVVEEGRWSIDTARGLISMQTTRVDGKAILSTMMPRWQVEELSGDQLILEQFISGRVYLLFEAKK